MLQFNTSGQNSESNYILWGNGIMFVCNLFVGIR